MAGRMPLPHLLDLTNHSFLNRRFFSCEPMDQKTNAKLSAIPPGLFDLKSKPKLTRTFIRPVFSTFNRKRSQIGVLAFWHGLCVKRTTTFLSAQRSGSTWPVFGHLKQTKIKIAIQIALILKESRNGSRRKNYRYRPRNNQLGSCSNGRQRTELSFRTRREIAPRPV